VPMVFADELFILEQSTECAIPGYLILRLKGEETSLARLAPEKARALGEMLARATAAIEETVGAERVYILSFCEVERRLHFHLFPRTAWLLKEYFKANSGETKPVNGPALFEWARRTIVQARHLPVGAPGPAAIAAAIRAILEREA
jgi:diadenosine tetraphosphate (Ap4A) HIT family hydrolase